MNALRIITFIGAAILIFFGVIFIWAAFNPEVADTWIIGGLITLGIGFLLIWLATRMKTSKDSDKEVTLKIDLSGDVNLDTLKCEHCGGALTTENIKMVAGAPVVDCPYCATTYQITEEPKW